MAAHSILNNSLNDLLKNGHLPRARDFAELKTSAAGLRRDEKATGAALTYQWSNVQTEGQMTKLKLLKRQGFGRSKLDLLHRRLIRPGWLAAPVEQRERRWGSPDRRPAPSAIRAGMPPRADRPRPGLSRERGPSPRGGHHRPGNRQGVARGDDSGLLNFPRGDAGRV